MKARHVSVPVTLVVVVVVVPFGGLGAACGREDRPSPPRTVPAPTDEGALGRDVGRTSTPAAGTTAPTARKAPAAATLQVTTILVVYRTPRHPEARRDRSEAQALARSLVARIRAGEPMERLLAEHSDDRGADGRVFNDGTYSLLAEGDAAQPGLVALARATPVGALAPEPYDAGNAFVVLRRDA